MAQPENTAKLEPWPQLTPYYPMASPTKKQKEPASPDTSPYPPHPIFVQNAEQQVNRFTFNVENAKIIHELCIHNF